VSAESDPIHVAGSPTIPGLVFRRFRGESDYPGMVAILNASAHALFLMASYRPVRQMADMVRPVAEPMNPAPLPAGLEVRPVRPEHVRVIGAFLL
jgi:hypothetical protein